MVKSSFRIALLLAAALPALPHDLITTKLTWAKEVSRVVFARCAGCHRPEGKAFSLLTYAEARPWAKAIQEETLNRRMPPWDAVKGFGEFAHERGLSQEEIHILSDWVEGGAPEGDVNLVPEAPKARGEIREELRGTAKGIADGMVLAGKESWVGLRLRTVPEKAGFRLAAELPSGEWVPLLWVESRSAKAPAEYEFMRPVELPAKTKIHLVTEEAGLRIEALVGARVPSRGR